MPLVTVPNVSEGRDPRRIETFTAAFGSSGARVLDIHLDNDHNRSVFTATASDDELIAGVVALADAVRVIDLRSQEGVHPRLGVLDVCPFVPYEGDMTAAIGAAHTAAAEIGDLGIPVFLYGEASGRPVRTELPDLRKGGLEGLARRMDEGLRPDHGPPKIDPRTGVVCVGARGPLIAFNVIVDGPFDDVVAIARTIRRPEQLRALAFPVAGGVQVSMNLIDPARLGIDDAFSAVAEQAAVHGIEIITTEIVGLVEERFLPDPDAQAARLLSEPGRSLESALRV